MSVFPNPIENTYLTVRYSITSNEISQLRIIDALGKILQEKEISQSGIHHFLLDKMPKGVYWVQLISETTFLSQKVVKQ